LRFGGVAAAWRSWLSWASHPIDEEDSRSSWFLLPLAFRSLPGGSTLPSVLHPPGPLARSGLGFTGPRGPFRLAWGDEGASRSSVPPKRPGDPACSRMPFFLPVSVLAPSASARRFPEHPRVSPRAAPAVHDGGSAVSWSSGGVQNRCSCRGSLGSPGLPLRPGARASARRGGGLGPGGRG